jgi:hypothetical protein
MNEMIDAIKVCCERKLQKVLVNFTQILTNNPLWVNLNICLFCHFSQVGIHLGKWSKRPYVDGKLLYTPQEEFL